jgi:hypothetical protein
MRVLLVLGLGLLGVGCGQSEASEVGRYTMMESEIPAAKWRLDTKTGELAFCRYIRTAEATASIGRGFVACDGSSLQQNFRRKANKLVFP